LKWFYIIEAEKYLELAEGTYRRWFICNK